VATKRTPLFEVSLKLLRNKAFRPRPLSIRQNRCTTADGLRIRREGDIENTGCIASSSRCYVAPSFGEIRLNPGTIVSRYMYRDLKKKPASEVEVQRPCDQFETDKLDGVNLQSVPADEAQRTRYLSWRLNACRTTQEKT